MVEMRTPQMISWVGNSFAIFIPHKIAELKGYKRGKHIMVNWEDMIENDANATDSAVGSKRQ